MAKATLKPTYATKNTVRFDESVQETGDFLNPPKPIIGSMYFEFSKLTELGWKGSAGPQYEAAGSNGKTYIRADVTGPSLEVSITVK